MVREVYHFSAGGSMLLAEYGRKYGGLECERFGFFLNSFPKNIQEKIRSMTLQQYEEFENTEEFKNIVNSFENESDKERKILCG